MNKMLFLLSASLVVSPAFAASNNQAASEPQPNTQASAPDMNEGQQLAYNAQDKSLSVEQRSEALQQLARFPNTNSLVAVARALKEPDPAIREAAIVGSEPYKLEHRWKMLAPLLEDEVQQVRFDATANLIRDYRAMAQAQKDQMEAPTQALIDELQQNAKDDEGSQTMLADVYRWHQEWDKADVIYQKLLTSGDENKNNPQLWLNYASNKQGQGLDQASIDILDQGLKQLPEDPNLHYAKSLALVRIGKKETAANEMQLAATLAKNNSYYWYLNGVIQQEFNPKLAIGSYQKAYAISGAPEHLYAVCSLYIQTQDEQTNACLDELSQVAPKDVVDQLKANAGIKS
ncbi:MAG: hypothetical protein ACPHV3_04490 [Vibrio sp.]